ncbi:MAG: DUF488 family protein [Candidatus Dependentiae bacterium]
MTKKYILYTIGHSNRTIEQFIELLKISNIKQVIDVRTIPKSGHNPQFNQNCLSKTLRNRHIGYRHMKLLGGLRHPLKNSLNIAWENSSFRGYADYMLTEEFEIGLEKLIVIAKKKISVIMCAEAVPWRCHRSLIGDMLLLRNFDVYDIIGKNSVRLHELTAWGRIVGKHIIYDKKS